MIKVIQRWFGAAMIASGICMAILYVDVSLFGKVHSELVHSELGSIFIWGLFFVINSIMKENSSKKELELKQVMKLREIEDHRKRIAERQQELAERERERLRKEELANEQEELERKKYLDKAKEEWDKYSSVNEFNKMDAMSGNDFEFAVKMIYQNMGYRAEVTPLTGDFGADVLVRIDEKQTSAIQVKRSRTNVGNKAVMEALAGMKHYNATHAIVLTNAKFTKAAMKQAKSADVELIDRDILYDMWCVAFPTENKLGEFSLDEYEKNKHKIHTALYGEDLSRQPWNIKK